MTRTEFVVLQPINCGRSHRAIPRLVFTSREAAQDHINRTIREGYRSRYIVSERAVKADKIAHAMHCQCCGRAIFAETGTIAHHGYTRPGQGWQTQSCFGAKRLPWEVDRGALLDMIEHLASLLVAHNKSLALVQSEQRPVSFTSQIYNRQTGKYFTHQTSFTRATFDEVLAKNEHAAFARHSEHTFDLYKQRDIEERKDVIRRITRSRNEARTRYDGWQQTHIRANDAWVKLDPTSINNGD